jgi:CO/xanthine dehydrogenase FAD-binding subunit
MTVTVTTYATVAEAAAVLGQQRGSRYFGGGTLLMRALNEGDISINALVRSSDRSLREIRASGGRIEIGAGVTMAGLLANRDVAFLHAPARLIGGPAVRSMATVGGNLFAPAPYGDLAGALLALEATVRLAHDPRREMPLEELLAGRGRRAPPLVASVLVPRPANAEAVRFRKVSRVRPKGISVLSIAANLPLSGGRISGARVAYNAMAPVPMRARAVERALEGRTLDTAGIAEALRVAGEGTHPPTDAIASEWYRRAVLSVHLSRLLLGEPRR